MIGEGIHEDALQHLVQQSAVREFVVGRFAEGLGVLGFMVEL